MSNTTIAAGRTKLDAQHDRLGNIEQEHWVQTDRLYDEIRLPDVPA
ncbi:hypothetical protein [Kibdelosporangium aridum]|nr:hypothetical protein [Kibdelosporangium aridum]